MGHQSAVLKVLDTASLVLRSNLTDLESIAIGVPTEEGRSS